MGVLPAYILEDSLVFRVGPQNVRQFYVRRELKENIMRITHEKYGHLGIDKCANQILKHYWIPNVKAKLNRFIGNYLKCIF